MSKVSILIEEWESEKAEEIKLGNWVEPVHRGPCLTTSGSLDFHSVFHHPLEIVHFTVWSGHWLRSVAYNCTNYTRYTGQAHNSQHSV